MSSSKDDVNAPCSAAQALMNVDSLDRDMNSAFAIVGSLASEGDSGAQYLQGLFLYTGTSVPRDRKMAVESFKASASSGNERAALMIKELEKMGECEALDDLVLLKLRAECRDMDACRQLFDMYDRGKSSVKKDHKVAVEYYTVCAEAGDVRAMVTIGFMYMMGKGVDKDKDTALHWLKSAAELGDGEAMYRIGYMYETGQCYTEPDFKEAAKWYTFGANAGNMDAQFSMGGLCCIPKTKYFDVKRAAKLFQDSADQGHPEAAYQIGMMYAFGEGVKRDPDIAVKYLEMSCEGGFQQAMVDYSNMRIEGQVLPKDDAIAAKWFEKAASVCNGYAEYALACMHGNGIYYEKSDEMAFKWFKDAAEMSEPNSQYCLGCFYYEGRGCQKNPEEAAVWFGEAAEQGQPAAMSFLGMMMVSGKDISQDIDGGLKLLHEAADEDGYFEAQYYIGKIHFDGKYVPRNIPLAKKYLGMASKQGDPDATALLTKIKTERIR